MAAGYHIERETDLHGDELRALPDDPAVAAAERDAACRAAAAARASEWHRLPRWLRRVVQGGAVAMVTSCYIVQFFSSSCFIAFEITDDIGEKLGGNALNVVRPLGRVAMALFAVACVCLQVRGFVGGRAATDGGSVAARYN